MKKGIVCLAVLLITVFLPGCTGSEQKAGLGEEPTAYIKKLPEHMNSGMKQFLLEYVAFNDTIPNPVKAPNLFAEGYITKEKARSGMAYYTLPEQKLEKLYTELRKSKNPSTALRDMRETAKKSREPVKPNEVKLPEITLLGEGKLQLKSAEKKEVIELKNSDKNRTFSDQLIIHLLAATDEAWLIDIWDMKEEQKTYLFVKADFTKQVQVEKREKELNAAYKTGDLDIFGSLFQSLENSQYAVLAGTDFIFDEKNRELVQVAVSDLLSKNGKQVYIGGGSPKEGKQIMMRTADYLHGKDPKEQFQIDPDRITKEIGLNGFAKLHNMSTLFFTEDFIVLRLEYKSYIADAGTIHVFVDLEGKEPKAYLVNLSND